MKECTDIGRKPCGRNKFSILYKNVLVMLLALILALSLMGTLGCGGEKTAKPNGLTINLMSKPLGVSLNSLRFGWQMNDPDDDEIQTAYRVAVANTKDGFLKGDYTYDSDWINSSKSAGVRLDDIQERLTANSLYYWAVSTKDKNGNESGFSQLQSFTTETADSWASIKGIWAAENGNKSDDSFVFLRSSFNAKRFNEVELVTAAVTATDTESARQFVYNLYFNGSCVGIGPCRTGIGANGEEYLYYNTYDVTSYISEGENVVSAINYADNGRMFLLQITAFYKDGTSEIWLNSGRDYNSWKCLPADDVFGKDNSIGTGYYTAYANNVDANIYPFGFSEVGFDDSGWNECICCEAINKEKALKSGEYYPMIRYNYPAAEVKRLKNGDYLVDLKQEIVGGIEIELEGYSGQQVNLYYGEQLNGDGSVKWQMNTRNAYCESFTLKNGKQLISTVDMLTYRYVQISGYDKNLSADSVKGLEIRAEFNDNDSSFKSDSQLLNDIFNLCKNTVKYTTQDVLVDSQSRERRCYEGDLLINALASYSVSSNLCSARLSLEYILTHPTAFIDYKLLSVVVAKQDYLYTGDDDVLINYYKVLKENCFSVPSDGNNHLVITENAGNLVIDWPENERDGYDVSLKFNTALNCIQYKTYMDFAYIAEIAGNEADSKTACEMAYLLKQSLIERCYDKEKGAFCDGLNEEGKRSDHYAQQATAYALWAGVFEQDMVQPMSDFVARNNEVKTSVYGWFYLLDGLYKCGNGNLANAMLLNEDINEGAKTYAYMLKVLNATLTTEAWNETAKDNMTLSHPWSASPAYFICSGICGIEPLTSGFDIFSVHFPCVSGFSECRYGFETVKGRIEVGLRTYGKGKNMLELKVPANTRAQIKIRCSDNKMKVSGKNVQADLCGNFCILEIGAGKTVIEYAAV